VKKSRFTKQFVLGNKIEFSNSKLIRYKIKIALAPKTIYAYGGNKLIIAQLDLIKSALRQYTKKFKLSKFIRENLNFILYKLLSGLTRPKLTYCFGLSDFHFASYTDFNKKLKGRLKNLLFNSIFLFFASFKKLFCGQVRPLNVWKIT